MSGVFTAAAGYSEVFAAGSTNFSELLATNVDGIIGKVLATKQDTSKLKWYGHPSVMMRYFQTLKDSNGDYLYANNKDGTGVGNVLGYPVRYVYEATAATASGGCMAVFGDLSGVYLGERLNAMSLFYDPYSDAVKGNDRFYWYTRWAFNLAQANKFGRIVTA
jgi:HK97 family phage major capsid protein